MPTSFLTHCLFNTIKYSRRSWLPVWMKIEKYWIGKHCERPKPRRNLIKIWQIAFTLMWRTEKGQTFNPNLHNLSWEFASLTPYWPYWLFLFVHVCWVAVNIPVLYTFCVCGTVWVKSFELCYNTDWQNVFAGIAIRNTGRCEFDWKWFSCCVSA